MSTAFACDRCDTIDRNKDCIVTTVTVRDNDDFGCKLDKELCSSCARLVKDLLCNRDMVVVRK